MGHEHRLAPILPVVSIIRTNRLDHDLRLGIEPTANLHKLWKIGNPLAVILLIVVVIQDTIPPA